MIITKTPLRITLGGGGTDFPPFAAKYGGQAITAAIDKYVYVVVGEMFEGGYRLKYTQSEDAESIDAIQHPIFRETLRFFKTPPRTEIISFADIPSGTGLGSSAAFTVGLCRALSSLGGQDGRPTKSILAGQASRVELEILGRAGGPQDHLACALGGLQILFFDHKKAGSRSLRMQSDDMERLEDRLQLFFTGYIRDADNILTTQSDLGLRAINAMGKTALRWLENGDLDRFGELLNDHWYIKRLRSPAMSNYKIDLAHKVASMRGAVGGKLVGAGGGGFLLFYADDSHHLSLAMEHLGLREVPFKFDYTGTTLCKL